MTTFVVSLFLPYTVDFHDIPSPKRELSPLRPLTASSRKEPKIDLPEKKASLFSVPTPPKTPAAADYAEFFSQLQPSAATHFPKPHDPRSLVRSDSHIPEWGGTLFFNQPRSQAVPAPPDTILEYAKAHDRTKAVKTRPARRSPNPNARPNSKSRDGSKDKGSWDSQWTIEPAVQGNGGLANAVRAAIDAGSIGDVNWVGLIGFPTDSLGDEIKDEIHERLESDLDSLTVFVSDTDLDGHYAHYCKTILWPVFNYQIPDHPKSKAYEDHSWIFYVHLNQAFADKVVKSYKRGDIIWVHDYHLLLVPAMIRKKLPDAQIGFFLHTAFPSSEVFRCLATRKELLEGMLGANLVAFQTREYAHHFLQTCSRLLTVEATEDGVQLEHHFVNVASFPIGIDPKGLSLAREDEEVLDWIKVMQERYHDKFLIVARDKLDNIRGVRQKLLAFELFLNKYPEWRDKVVLIQVATSTTENSELAATVSEIVTRIESVHSTLAHQPLVFLMQDIPFSQYLALLSVADVLMVTSLREGMNLTCHEYVFCQDGKQSDKKHGPIILSEFTGSAAVFEGNELSINPWDYQKCAEAIKIALEMEPAEKDRRYNKIRDIVMHHTGDYWVANLRKELAKVHDEHFRNDTMSIPRLSAINLGEKYKKSNKRLFLLDYEGTLASYGSVTNIVLSSPQRVIEALNDLISEEKNIVYVMSSRTIEELQLIFDRVPGLGLIAENGCFVREYGGLDEWIEFSDSEITKKWKESVLGILKYYEERVEGSWIEERRCSLIFHYEKADEYDAANRQAGDCANHINDACESQRVRAIPTKDTVCVEPMDWDKRTAAIHILNNLRQSGLPDFLMVAGNDRDDEIIFRWANEIDDSKTIPNVTTVSVGNRNTVAKATLTQGTTGLLSALGRLSKLG
ncbi:alpha,alpha-trehalose phosphate synthase-like protein subunit [Mytilinidion resinicola]|uniref:Alpha,alpha-trehalose phosphate synthase-like protein subunit n=1 Tax=Mytilinidion resinicola TaxID=574789 RepID=A0A6A6YPL7_9PEZI|nr:alpha,alpha-trehalose phosphate synthase-like protein subunit [Mytilinidion resinicola]KAF2809964.1 alpha,alpha-trehalose phosphate synthase-like protein subunit [Mytilinidion resinicola]